MKKLLLILLFPIFVFGQEQVKTKIFNPQKKWFFGAEIGSNTILSNDFETNSQFQFGFLAEYYVSKYWSFQSKIKMYRTEVAYSKNSTFLSNGAKPYSTLFFEGNIISIPIDAKWEFKISKNFRGFFNFGMAYNIETYSHYEVPFVQNPDLSNFPSQYISFNYGYGFNYAISKNISYFLSIESNSGGYKGNYGGFLFSQDITSRNRLLNLGIKYNFKKQSK